MEKGAQGLEMQEKSFQGAVWKTVTPFHGKWGRQSYPHFQHLFPREKSGKCGNRRPYFLALMLEVMSRTVSAKAVSFFMRCSTCSMECITVVWSRSPNSLPMSL